MSQPPYAPVIKYLCDDEECCENGCPAVTCKSCGKGWPCPDYIASHTPVQVEAQHRYVDRKWFGDDEGMLAYKAKKRALKENP